MHVLLAHQQQQLSQVRNAIAEQSSAIIIKDFPHENQPRIFFVILDFVSPPRQPTSLPAWSNIQCQMMNVNDCIIVLGWNYIKIAIAFTIMHLFTIFPKQYIFVFHHWRMIVLDFLLLLLPFLAFRNSQSVFTTNCSPNGRWRATKWAPSAVFGRNPSGSSRWTTNWIAINHIYLRHHVRNLISMPYSIPPSQSLRSHSPTARASHPMNNLPQYKINLK